MQAGVGYGYLKGKLTQALLSTQVPILERKPGWAPNSASRIGIEGNVPLSSYRA